MLRYLAANASNVELVSSWGTNDWLFNAQRNIPSYLLSTPNGTVGGLLATYYADTAFSQPMVWVQETPDRDWGLWPPNGLPSNNFSVVWEGLLSVPVDGEVDGWIGVAVSANATARLYIDDVLIQHTPLSTKSSVHNIPRIRFTKDHGADAPMGGTAFKFQEEKVHRIRVEFQAWNLHQKVQNIQSVNSEVELFWNLGDRGDSIGKVSISSPINCHILPQAL
jgi:hypothetical protein